MGSKVTSKNFDVLGYRAEKISTELCTSMTSLIEKTRILANSRNFIDVNDSSSPMVMQLWSND